MMSAAMSWSFAVAVLRRPAQEIECDGCGAALLGHQDADGLVDDAAGNHGLGQLRLGLGLTGLPQRNCQCRRALPARVSQHQARISSPTCSAICTAVASEVSADCAADR